MLVSLDSSVVVEVETLRATLHESQAAAKEAEVTRMRAELQLANLERIQTNRELDALKHAGSRTTGHSSVQALPPAPQPSLLAPPSLPAAPSSSHKSILRSNPSTGGGTGDGTCAVLPGRKNVVFTDEGDMVIKPSPSKQQQQVLELDLSSPIHSPYDRYIYDMA